MRFVDDMGNFKPRVFTAADDAATVQTLASAYPSAAGFAAWLLAWASLVTGRAVGAVAFGAGWLAGVARQSYLSGRSCAIDA